MPTPLIDGLKKYIDENNIRMHMPGHKAKNSIEALVKLLPELDVTEVKGVDNLHSACEIIKESQQNASRVFGAKETFFSVNGTTSGIYASILSQTSEGDTVLVQRDSHKSVYQALVFGKLNAEYLYPKYDYKNNMLLGLDPEEIDEKLKTNNSIRAVVVTYPTYYGVCSDLRKIASIVKSYGKILIVDEAHGSHLSFNKRLPESSLKLGADIVIQSTHKTLPAFTQSSMVHIGSDKVDKEKLKTQMSIFQTTSPSYILLSSLDFATDYAEKCAEERLDVVLNKIEEVTDYFRKLPNVRVFNGEEDAFNDSDVNSGVVTEESYRYRFDKTKFLFKIDGITGTHLEEILRTNYKIQLEMSDHYYGLALLTMSDDLEDIEKLMKAIEDISKNKNYTSQGEDDFKDVRIIRPKIVFPSHKAFYSDKISVQLGKAEGEVSAEFIIPYPPGVPILAPGEEVTKDIIKYLEKIRKENIEVLSSDRHLETIRVISKIKFNNCV